MQLSRLDVSGFADSYWKSRFTWVFQRSKGWFHQTAGSGELRPIPAKFLPFLPHSLAHEIRPERPFVAPLNTANCESTCPYVSALQPLDNSVISLRSMHDN
jgi:hypothetical protein